MKILSISGSSRSQSSNVRLLEAIPVFFPKHTFQRYNQLDQLPLFKAEEDKYPWHPEVLNWREAIAQSDAAIICIPEYIHNMPALIKNALEWVASSGELVQKRVLPMTFTPYSPRGEKAMQSLLWCLQALDAQVVTQLPLYQNEITFDTDSGLVENEAVEMLKEAVGLLN